MARRGIPDCPVLNPEHDGYGAAKLFRGHPYEVEESYSYTTNTVSNNSSNIASTEDEDDDNDSYEDYYNENNSCFNGPFYRVNINVRVNAGDATAMTNVLNLIKELHKLENE